ncbi:MAG TPA: CcmD family protein [Bacteroidia bacterium]|jgi:CcmD family protein
MIKTSSLNPLSKGKGVMSVKIMAAILLFFVSASSFAQETPDNAPVEMATGLYQSGKIYVVVIVLCIVMAGIAGYLIMLDRKVSRLEKEIGK